MGITHDQIKKPSRHKDGGVPWCHLGFRGRYTAQRLKRANGRTRGALGERRADRFCAHSPATFSAASCGGLSPGGPHLLFQAGAALTPPVHSFAYDGRIVAQERRNVKGFLPLRHCLPPVGVTLQMMYTCPSGCVVNWASGAKWTAPWSCASARARYGYLAEAKTLPTG